MGGRRSRRPRPGAVARGGVVRGAVALVVATVALLASGAVASAQAPPTGGGSVSQTLTVEVPPHAVPPTPPGSSGAPGRAGGAGAAGPSTGSVPTRTVVPSGSLPRTGVGPWFWPTVILAVALVLAGVVVTSTGDRLRRRAVASA